MLDEARNELEGVSVDDNIRSQCFTPLERLLEQTQKQDSTAHLHQAEQEALKALDRALEKIETSIRMPSVKEEIANEPPVKKANFTV